jgi:hypothetical protein
MIGERVARGSPVAMTGRTDRLPMASRLLKTSVDWFAAASAACPSDESCEE